MPEPNADGHGNGYSDGKRNSDRYSNGDGNCDCKCHADGNCVANAAVYPDSKAVSDASAASGQLLFRQF